jgi:hypothetical protein
MTSLRDYSSFLRFKVFASIGGLLPPNYGVNSVMPELVPRLRLNDRLHGPSRHFYAGSRPARGSERSLRLVCALLLIGGAVIAVSAPAAWGSNFNVLSYGATGNGLTDDAPGIQKAEKAAELAGGGSVYLPAGRYLMNSTVLVGSNIEIYGDGDSTVLMRTNTLSPVPEYGADCLTIRPPVGGARAVFWNRHYNCADRNIHLHDFKADGSAITSVPDSVLLAFSGLVDSIVERITVVNAPQDAMFFRNGGENLTVKDNKILLHNTLWGNGEGINIEMHVNGQIWGPVKIANNQIVTGATNFCSAALNRSCARDSDCSGLQPATCGKGASTSAAIGITWVDGTHPPVVSITNNHIWAGNDHYGILCNGCVDSTISGNVILPAKLKGLSGRGTFTGITSHSGARATVHNLTIERNTIEGTGESEDSQAIHVAGLGIGENGLAIRENLIVHKNTSNTKAVIQVGGWDNIDISRNHLCFVPRNDIRLESSWRPVVNQTQAKNTIVPIEKQSGTPPAECSALPQ